MTARYTENEVADALVLYRAGATSNDVALVLERDPRGVRHLLRRHGVLKFRQKYSDPAVKKEAKRSRDRAYVKETKQDPARRPKRLASQRAYGKRRHYSDEVRRADVARTRAWQAANPGKVRLIQRRANLAKYGITPEQYDGLYAKQGGACSICRLPKLPFGSGSTANRGEVLTVDHDHTTGKVRALLCLNCNNLLGRAKDREAILAAAIEYLKKHRHG